MMTTDTILGIDYSLNSPAICVSHGDPKDVRNCTFYFVPQKKAHTQLDDDRFKILRSADFSDVAATVANAQAVIALITAHQPKHIFIEGYSFGSRVSSVTTLAENMGVLKAQILMNYPQVLPQPLAPQSVKKHATGSGRADKQMMYDAWYKATAFDLSMFEVTASKNPVSDIVDSWWIAVMGWDRVHAGSSST